MFTSKHHKSVPKHVSLLAGTMLGISSLVSGCRSFTQVKVPSITPSALLASDKQDEYNAAVKALDDSILPFMQECERLKEVYLKHEFVERFLERDAFSATFYPSGNGRMSALYVQQGNDPPFVLPHARAFIEAWNNITIMNTQLEIEGKGLPQDDITQKTANKILSIFLNLEKQTMTSDQRDAAVKEITGYLNRTTQATLYCRAPSDIHPAIADKLREDVVRFIENHPNGFRRESEDDDLYLPLMAFANDDGRTEQKLFIPDVKTLSSINDQSQWNSEQCALITTMQSHRKKWDSKVKEESNSMYHKEATVLMLWDITMDMYVVNPSSKEVQIAREKLENTAIPLPERPKTPEPTQLSR